MSSQQIKAFVSLRQFDQITQFDVVNDEQIVKAYQFTEELQSLGARMLANAVAGIGTQAIVAERGLGKSHLLNLLRSIANVPRLINLLEDPNAIATFQRIALPKLPSDGFPTLTLGFDPEKGLNLVKAYPRVPGMENFAPANLIAYVDEIIEQKINTGVQIALFIDGISQFLTDPQQGEPLLQWLQELAKEAVNGKFSLMITLDQSVAEGPLRKTLSSVFKYEYIPTNTIGNIIDQKIFYKAPTQRRQLENLFWDLRKRMPHFLETVNRFVQLYPINPVLLNLVPSVRFYARSFSLFGFITAISSRALLRRVFNLICADELFDSFEFDLRKHPSLTDAFVSYDYLFNYIPSMQHPDSLYAKMMVKGLMLFSLSGKAVTAKELASALMLYDEREPIEFIETLNSIMSRLADTGSGLIINTESGDLTYKFYIPENTSIALLSSTKSHEVQPRANDSQARTITKTLLKEKPEGENNLFEKIKETPLEAKTLSTKEIVAITPQKPAFNTKEIVAITPQKPGGSRFSTKENPVISEPPLTISKEALEKNVIEKIPDAKSPLPKNFEDPPKHRSTKLFPTVPPPPVLQEQVPQIISPTSNPLPMPAKSITEASSTPLSLDKLTIAVSKIADDDINLDQLLVSGGKKFFKDWPLVFEDNKFQPRAELIIKWRGSLRKGVIKFQGETEIYKDTESQIPCDYDWQVTIFRAYAPMVLPPPPDFPNTLLHWQPIALSSSERLVLKQLLVITQENIDLGDEKEVANFKLQLEEQVNNLFLKVYLKSRLLTNQHVDLNLSNEGTSLIPNLTKLLDKLFAKRYPLHPNFEDLLTQETVIDLLPWFFQPKTIPNPDQVAALEQFVRPLDLIFSQEDSHYKISDIEKDVPKNSPLGQLWQAIEKNQTLTKLQAFQLVHKEPFGLQRPTLLLILAFLAGTGQVTLLDELNEPIHDSEGLNPDLELSDFSSIKLLQDEAKQVSWKTVKKTNEETDDYQNSTLLVVDDDATIHMVLKIAAQKLKCKIETAMDGLTALEKLNNLSVDLLISDLRMPNMTGIELFQNLQNNPRLMNVPFVVLSSIDDDEEVAAALEQGVEDYWIKPLRVNEIQARIKRLLARKSSKSALENKEGVKEKPQTKINSGSLTPPTEDKSRSARKVEAFTKDTINNPDNPTGQKLLDLFQQQAEKEITILPSKSDIELIRESILGTKKAVDTQANKLETETVKSEQAQTLSQDPISFIPHPPIPKQTIEEQEEQTISEENLKDKKASKTLQRPSKSTDKPNDALAIPSRTDEIPALRQLPHFEIKDEDNKPNVKLPSESSPISFNINLSNPEGMLMEIMQLYNHFWDTCRRVGQPTTIPEYEEFKELVITKATKLKKQFHWDEVTFVVVVEDDQAYIDCQINRTSNFLKTPPKFRVL
jgi:DNA-binding response OmpR family regulator